MAGLVDAYCSGCDLDRSADPTLDATTRTPCPQCGVSALTYKGQMTETVAVTASVSYVMTPGDQTRTWKLRWRTIESALAQLEQLRQGSVERATIEDAERELLGFYVMAYHLKDALIKDVVAPKQDIEDAVNNSPTLSLLADLANLDKHHKRDPKKHPPRSGHVPTIKSRQAASDVAGWRLKSTIEHNGRDLDGLTIAREAVDAWKSWLQAKKLL